MKHPQHPKPSFKLSSTRAVFLALIFFSPSLASGAVDNLVGHYEGSWSNITFTSTGAAVIDIDVMGTNASLTFDMDGGVFGGTNPASITMPGTVNGDLIQIDNQGVGIYGDIKGHVDSNLGTLTATLTNIPGGYIQQVLVDGTVSNGLMSLNYTVEFPRPPDPFNPAHGIMAVSMSQMLTINQVSLNGTNVVLKWTGGVPPFTVQTRPHLVRGNWTVVGDAITNSTFTVPHSAFSNAFFRVGGQ